MNVPFWCAIAAGLVLTAGYDRDGILGAWGLIWGLLRGSRS